MAVDINETRVNRSEGRLWIFWTLATALGMAAGLLPFLLFIEYLPLWLGRIIVPVFAGFMIGLFQWLALRPYINHSSDWMLTGGAGWSLGYALGLLLLDLLAGSLIGAIAGSLLFGLILAVFQYPVLRREIPSAIPWLAANVFGWAAGALLSQLVLNLFVTSGTPGQFTVAAVNALVTGLTAGAVTGAALVFTVRKPDIADIPGREV